MIIIGSHALGFHLPLPRTCKDIDVIATYSEFNFWIKRQKEGNNIKECYPANKGKKMIVKTNSNIYEFEIAWDDSTAKSLSNLVYNDKNTHERYFDSFGLVSIPSLDVLYTIKLSHKYLKNNPFFLKTMRDLQFMAKNGASIPDEYKDWLKAREKETYDYAHPKLNQNKSNFFNMNEGVIYVYDHDTIHLAMAHLDKPAYTFFKDEEKEVMCSKKKFFESPKEVQIYSVLEESYVLALERSQIPFKDKVDPKRSFDIALEKVCTSIASGWWREFAYNHYDITQSLYNPNYVNKFWKAVEDGVVKKL